MNQEPYYGSSGGGQATRVWPWIFGGVAVLCFIGIAFVFAIFGIASLPIGNSNTNPSNMNSLIPNSSANGACQRL